MKKNLPLIAAIVIAFAACKKEDSFSPTTGSSESVQKLISVNSSLSMPTSFTKKVMVEEFVGTGYGDSPEIIRLLNAVSPSVKQRIVYVAHHNNDILESQATDPLVTSLSTFGSAGYPSATFDRSPVNGHRMIGCTFFNAALSQELNKPASCGMTMQSEMQNRKVIVDINTGFSTGMNGNYKIFVYVTEDRITGLPAYAQSNNFNNTLKSPFYHAGNPMTEFTHNSVMRFCATSNGISLPVSKVAGSIDHEQVMFDLPSSCNVANCSIVAFVCRMNSSGGPEEILNVQSAKIGAVQGWN